MAITRWTPFQELESLERRMRRALHDAGFAPTLLPAADIYETDDEIVVEVEVPGFEEQELAIEVTDHTLVVKGEQSEETSDEKRAYRLHERLERTFERRFPLPREADTESVTAGFAKGILEVHTPKIPATTTRTIPIDARE